MEWKEIIKSILSKNNTLVDYAIPNNSCPEPENVFKVFKVSPGPEHCNVIMVGQDPYPQPGVATGIAFGLKEGSELQPSLSVILDEISRYYKNPFYDDLFDRTLMSWVNQGVLMLNASLTCSLYKPEGLTELMLNGTHSYYWRKMLMEDLFKWLDHNTDDKVFVFMGEKAAYYERFITNPTHSVFKTVHPVYDFHKGANYFRGSDIFTKINDSLTLKNKTTIEW